MHPTITLALRSTKNQPKDKHMITLECNYSKKLGLPQYSSHQFSVTLRTEIADIAAVQKESARLYALLQQSVDASIQQTGFLPQNDGNTPNGSAAGNGNSRPETWACSQKQRDLILKIVEENGLDKAQVETLAQDRFGKSVRALNKLEASGLIDELIQQTGGAPNGNRGRRFGNRNAASTR
ncbi:MAG: hypothetical protein ACREIC_12410 [Limisphaerales bacterium]